MLIPKMKFDYIYALYVHFEGLLKAFCCLKIVIFKCFFLIYFLSSACPVCKFENVHKI